MALHNSFPTEFKDYKQTHQDGACELYAMLFGFVQVMGEELQTQYNEDEEGNITITFKYLQKQVTIKKKSIDKIIKIKDHTIKQYHPSPTNNPILIAFGLAYQEVMQTLGKELLGEYGTKNGYTANHLDYRDLKSKPGSVADLLLNKRVDYLSKMVKLELASNGDVFYVLNNERYKYNLSTDNIFIICPENNHAVTYYYKDNKWYKFNNQTELTSKSTWTLTAQGQEPIRIIHNKPYDRKQKYNQLDEKLWSKIENTETLNVKEPLLRTTNVMAITATPLAKFWSAYCDEAESSCCLLFKSFNLAAPDKANTPPNWRHIANHAKTGRKFCFFDNRTTRILKQLNYLSNEGIPTENAPDELKNAWS